MTTLNTIIEEEHTPDTEEFLKKNVERASREYARKELETLLTSRDTYWKERVGDINKSFVGFMEAFVENGDNAIDLESLEEWRQHTLLDNLK